MRRPSCVLLLLPLVLAACGRRPAPAPRVSPVDRSDGVLPEVTAVRVPRGAITPDARLDEPVWARAGSTGGFVHPGNGMAEPASRVQGSARLAWDEDHLYVAFEVQDPDPTSPFTPADRDPHVWERSSGVEIMLQPGDHDDNRDYFEIQVDVAGAIWSTRFDDYNRPITDDPAGGRRFGHQDWDPALRVGAAADPRGGYVVELALPWTAVAGPRAPTPPAPDQIWRANFYTFRDGQGDALAWSPLLGQGNFHRASRFGRIRFAAE